MTLDIVIGKITKTKFINGIFLVSTDSDIVKETLIYHTLFIHDKYQVHAFEVSSVKQINSRLLQIKLKGLDNVNDVKNFVGLKVSAHKEFIQFSSQNDHDLYKDYEVWLENKLVGKVVEVHNFGSANVIRINGQKNSPALLIPETDDYISTISNHDNKIILKQIPDM